MLWFFVGLCLIMVPCFHVFVLLFCMCLLICGCVCVCVCLYGVFVCCVYLFPSVYVLMSFWVLAVFFVSELVLILCVLLMR